jgi:hypothetical protein
MSAHPQKHLSLTCRGNYASFWNRPVPVSKKKKVIGLLLLLASPDWPLGYKTSLLIGSGVMRANLEERIRPRSQKDA